MGIDVMAARFFPAGTRGTCAICRKPYERGAIVAYAPKLPAHIDCVVEAKNVSSAPAFVPGAIDQKAFDAFCTRVMDGLNPTMQPYPFQLEGAYRVEVFGGNALNGDDMGLGKTISSICTLAAHPELRPAVVVTPASVKLNWERELRKWLRSHARNAVTVLSGKTPRTLQAAGIYVINYDVLKAWLPELLKIQPQMVIADECHYLKNPKALRTIAMYGNREHKEYLRKGVRSFIALSGTPATNRPIEFWPTVHAIRPDVFKSWKSYAVEFCGAFETRFGWDTSGATNTVKLGKLLRDTMMIRREKAAVLPQLPEKTRSTIPMEIDNASEYRFAQKEFLAWVKQSGANVSGALKAEALVKIEKLKQLAAHGKMAQAIEWTTDFLDSNASEKLVVFAHHKTIADEIITALGKYGVVSIRGGMPAIERQRSEDAFRTNPKIRVIVCSLRAAREGINLQVASNVVFFELGWGPGEHNQAEDRVHRIGQNQACMAYYLLAANTIEEEIAALIDNKRAVLTSILDGREVKSEDSILGALLQVLRKAA